MKKIITIILAVLLLLSIGANVFLGIKNADLNKELESSQQGKTESASELENIQKEKDELSTKLEESESSKQELTTKLEETEKAKEETTNKLNTKTKDYKELQSEYKELKKQYDELLEKYNKECVTEVEKPQNLNEYAKNISYENISRTPDKYKGKAICYTGEVVQLVEGDGVNALRVAINGDYGNMFYLEYEPKIITERVLENDTITFYGIYFGIYQYESAFGTTISIPAATVDYIEIK